MAPLPLIRGTERTSESRSNLPSEPICVVKPTRQFDEIATGTKLS